MGFTWIRCGFSTATDRGMNAGETQEVELPRALGPV